MEWFVKAIIRASLVWFTGIRREFIPPNPCGDTRRKNASRSDGEVEAGRSLILSVGLGRVELPTSRLSGVRSNHLSYRPFQSLES